MRRSSILARRVAPVGAGLLKLAFAAAAASACVPSSDAGMDPRGAAGARFRPGAVAQGAAFTTSDGWTVTVERIALVALLATAGRDNVGGSRFLIWDGARASETYIPALPVGEFAMSVQPEGLYRNVDDVGRPSVDPDTQQLVDTSGLASDVAAGVLAPPDNVSSILGDYTTTSADAPEGPAVIFAAHAVKDGRTVHVSLALASSYQSGMTTEGQHEGLTTIDVKANDVLFVEYEVHPERIFAVKADDPTTAFEPLAAADRSGNDDGTVSADELRAVLLRLPVLDDAGDAGGEDDAVLVPTQCSGQDYGPSFACVTLLDLISDNAQHVLLARSP